MLNGNKETSERLFKKSFKKIQKIFIKKNSIELLKFGLINSSPVLFLKNIKRKRKKTMEFPFLLNPNIRLFYGIKSILKTCSNKQNLLSFYEVLQTEIIQSSKNIGQSTKIKKNLHEESVVKKKFANYRWF